MVLVISRIAIQSPILTAILLGEMIPAIVAGYQ